MPAPRRGRPIKTGPKRTTADAVAAAELRSGKAKRVISISDFSALTGYDRGTVTRWIGRGCPVEGKGAKGAVLLDVREVMEWREEQAREEERRRSISPEDTVEDGDEDRILKREQIKAQRIKTAERVGILVPAKTVLMTNAAVLNGVRVAIDGLDERIIRTFVGFPAPVLRKAKEEIKEQCRSTLMIAQKEMERAFKRVTRDRLAEIGADIDDEFDADDEEDLDVDPEEDLDGEE